MPRLVGVVMTLLLVSGCAAAPASQVVAAVGGEPGAAAPAAQVVAEVGGEPVTAAEFTARMAEHRVPVTSYFHERHRADANAPGFWAARFGGETPRAVLRQRTLDAIVRIKVQQLMARDAGLISDLSYDAFLRGLDEENRARRERIDRRQPVFGPRQHTEKSYFSHVFDRMVLDLRQALPDGYPELVDERVRGAVLVVHDDVLESLLP